jgi:CMP-N-acetylneuraminic acid synthetase/spore coat polysaccharide biosynthesis predicted glycosyltransferase SpsG
MPVFGLVPARGGSSTLPRKNMRTVGGRPLLAHTIAAIRTSRAVDELVVSTDDQAIRTWAELHGCKIHSRSAELATDEADLGELAAVVAEEFAVTGILGVFPPTNPFRSAATIDAAVRRFRQSYADSLSTCVRTERVHWYAPSGSLEGATKLGGPESTSLGAEGGLFRDNGAIYLVDAATLRARRRLVTDAHVLFEMSPSESLRVDRATDLVEARRRVNRGLVVFRVRADKATGSGHVFHCLQLADELADQHVSFLLKDCEAWVEEMIRRFNYSAVTEQNLAIDLERLASSNARVVVNDVLDTSETEVLIQRGLGYKVVNIEDLGPGSRFADWVVNALYRPVTTVPQAAWGPRYATLRDEFQDLPPKTIRDQATRVLITFGGTDPAGLACRCVRILNEHKGIKLHVILGPGTPSGSFPDEVTVSRSLPSMAQAMLESDIVLTSAGRTVYEAARTGTPVIVLAQNAREATHAHLGYESGVVFLGIGPLVPDEQIMEVVSRMLDDTPLRRELSRRLQSSIDDGGTRRVGAGIRELLDEASHDDRSQG